jgi:hypothetical protein
MSFVDGNQLPGDAIDHLLSSEREILQESAAALWQIAASTGRPNTE